jgi:hypothetical protein
MEQKKICKQVKLDVKDWMRNNWMIIQKDVIYNINKMTKKIVGGNGKKSLDNEDNFVNQFNNDHDYELNILGHLKLDPVGKWKASLCKKDNGHNVNITDEWRVLKQGTKERTSRAKTDVVISNGVEHVGISLKCDVGRATSADVYETNAIFQTSFKKYIQNNYMDISQQAILDDYVNNICKNMLKEKLSSSKLRKGEMDKEIKKDICQFKIDYPKEYDWYIKLTESCKICNDIWKKICTEFPSFKQALIRECLTGEMKFGNNIGRANNLIVLENSNTTHVTNVIDLDNSNDNYSSYCDKIGNGNVFACKSSGDKLWQRFL